MVNVMYCGNKKIFDGLLISSLSMAKNTKASINLYILTMDLTDENPLYTPMEEKERTYIDSMLKEYNPESKVILCDVTDLYKKYMGDSVNTQTTYTPYTFLRLFADKIPGFPKKIAYLDTDTVVREDIQELYGIDMDNYECAVVLDYLGKTFINRKYFNAGVMLFNIEKIRETKLFDRTIEMCNNKKMGFPDQTALNKLVKYKLYLPSKFNEQRKCHKNTIIQHFSKSIRWLPYFHTVNVKPWDVENVKKVLKIHIYDDLLIEYQNRINEYRKEEVKND